MPIRVLRHECYVKILENYLILQCLYSSVLTHAHPLESLEYI